MKKFLDLSCDPKGSPSYRQSEQKACIKLLKKLQSGIKSENYPYLYWYNSHEEAVTSLYFSLFCNETIKTGRNQFLFEAGSSRSILEFARASKNMNMIATLIPYEKTGELSLDQLKSKLGAKSLLFSSRLVNPVLGLCDDHFAKISQILSDFSVYHFLDISMGLGTTFSDLSPFEADYLTYTLPFDGEVQGTLLFSKKEIKAQINPPRDFKLQELEKLVLFFEELYEKGSSKLLHSLSIKMHLVQMLKKEMPQIKAVFEPSIQSHDLVCLHLPHIHHDALNFVLQTLGAAIELGGGKELVLSELLNLVGYDNQFSQSCFTVNLSSIQNQQQLEEFVQILKSAYEILSKGVFS